MIEIHTLLPILRGALSVKGVGPKILILKKKETRTDLILPREVLDSSPRDFGVNSVER